MEQYLKDNKMKITTKQLRKMIKEEKAKMLNEKFGMESLNPLVGFGEAWSGLGSSVGEQILELSNAYIDGRMEDVLPELNPNAVRLAYQRLSPALRFLEGDDAETLKEALEQALEMMKR